MSEDGAVFSDATATTGDGDLMIEVDHVDKFFGDFQALRDINLRVGAQEVVVIIGPSGSGKSTLIRCINRLEEHQAGRIVVDGTELSSDLKNIDKVRSDCGLLKNSAGAFCSTI